MATLAHSPDRADALCIASWAHGRRALSEQTRAALEAATRSASTDAWRRQTTEEEFAGVRLTEERWGRPRPARIVDSDLPAFR